MEAIDINDTFGAMLIGALVTMVTYGITTLQACVFLLHDLPTRQSQDKIFCGVNMDIGHSPRRIHVPCNPLVSSQCADLHGDRYAYLYFKIAGFGNPAHLVEGTWSLFSSIMINVIIALLVQCFFALRIHGLCPKPYKWWMTSVIGSMVFAHFCFGLGEITGVSDYPSANNHSIWQKLFVKKEFSRLNEVNFVAVLPFGITAILSDILIAVGLCLLLERSRTDFANTNYLITTLIGYAITRCLLTSLMAVVEVIIFVTKPTSFYSFAIDFVIGKLWSNSLLASLNSRRSLRDTFNRKDSGTMSTGFRVASPELSTAGAEPGQLSLVRIPRQGESKSSDEEIGSCTKISTQASRQSSELRFSAVDTQRTQ
ncbi:uncharacterized protein ARMOST_13031 [Armillaria ostoyae]|uniref:DUF6534 domain-containing protein n=1 Tax=Armillaria ostoyae TaxID=47428 RepID=A0A284RLM3_ARMOS|nr:uncharacterized protein ARMOST_13031 [Armillaria ostoyae]